MKLVPTNRMVNGLVTRVFDPETGQALAENEVIDLDNQTFYRKQHFLRVMKEGDLIEYVEPPQPAKKV